MSAYAAFGLMKKTADKNYLIIDEETDPTVALSTNLP